MKIAFPLVSDNILAADFTHAHFVGVFDTEMDKIEILSIDEIDKKTGNSSFSQTLISVGINVVVSAYYSFMSLRVFKENSIEPYKASSADLHENIAMYKAKELYPYDVVESLLIGDCARDCIRCSTTCS
jgi:predicted Fe-Mo cluster-binding NifX family protein